MENVKKTSLGKSPEAKNRLLEIKPNEVSAVDMPAIGEPFFVVKGLTSSKSTTDKSEDALCNEEGSHQSQSDGLPTALSKNGGEPVDAIERARKSQNGSGSQHEGELMSMKKIDATQVPRRVMKVLHGRLSTIVSSIAEINQIAKNLTISKSADEEPLAPKILVEMTKAAASDIRSLQPDDVVSISKRGHAEAVLSLQELVKREEEIAKVSAVSYLVRERYVNATQNVSEWLSTYVDGIEHDDDGPMLIPVDLDSTIDKTATALEDLADEYPVDEDVPEPNEDEAVEKLHTEISRLKSVIANRKVGKTEDMTATTLKRLRTVSSSVNEALVEVSKLADYLEGTNEETMTVKKTEKSEEVIEETAVEETAVEETTDESVEETSTDDVADDATDTETETTEEETTETVESETTDEDADPITKALLAFEGRISEKFENLEKKIENVQTVAKSAEEKVEKFSLARADSKGGATDNTTKVIEKSDDKALFAGLLNLPNVKR